MQCVYCGWRRGGHDPQCPNAMSQGSVERETALADFRRGRDHGRGGKEPEPNSNPAYMLGWGQGVVALEEAENGYDPRFD